MYKKDVVYVYKMEYYSAIKKKGRKEGRKEERKEGRKKERERNLAICNNTDGP